ncbi:MAG: DUF3581 domain-containing protein [Chromatiales bacterium]|nr:DUF3581 domain-containing protein [Chromatiales bacterium]
MTHFLDAYHCKEGDTIYFTKQQGSRFAKEIADDFNPLHDPDNKLFCVPGDLLFSLALSRYGLSEKMRFAFTGMISANLRLRFQEPEPGATAIIDADDKTYLTVEHSGSGLKDQQIIEQFSRAYVAFSGHNFPDLLVPLMADNQVMINPQRPIAIYDSMEIEIDHITQVTAPMLTYTAGHLEVKGKKGDVRLEFDINSNGRTIGKGIKYMSLRGLKPYDQVQVDQMVESYNSHKQEYTADR